MDKMRIFIYIMLITPPVPLFDHLLESSHREDFNKWSNIGFGQEITQVMSIEVHFTHVYLEPFNGSSQENDDCIMRSLIREKGK